MPDTIITVMAQIKPSVPKGMRDFSPAEAARRNYIFDTVREVFRLYGYQPLETPAMENLSTLLGKYGEEGDRLLFRVLNSGDFTGGLSADDLLDSTALSGRISEKGLRYDLTVPLARYVVQHRAELAFPFKRYQIQPVWRADRPQKGRYREFYQCDADMIGSRSLLAEAELMSLTGEVFRRLGIRVVLKVNNRKILAGMAEIIGYPDRLTDITVAIDKLDKIGRAAVEDELSGKGIVADAIARLRPIFDLGGTNEEKLDALEDILSGSPIGLKGVEEIRTVLELSRETEGAPDVELDLSLARGLNYYTGAIFEVKARDYPIGSICGGGRYDDLTGIFGLPDTSGVGISFGADRIYDVMLGLGLFPDGLSSSVRAMFLNFGGREQAEALKLLHRMRSEGIAAEIYPEPAKIRRQMEYADRRGIPFVIIAGKAELASGKAAVRNMADGTQTETAVGDLVNLFL